ncbi:uncharacterized protein LOC144623224 [Crassostrea virginica]
MRARKVVLDWLHLRLLGPGCLPMRFSPVRRSSRTTSGRRWTPSVWRSGRSPPPRTPWKENCTRPCCSIGGCRHTWWVTSTRTPGEVARVVAGAPGQRYSLQAFTLNRGLPLQVRQVVVVKRWTPEPPRILPQRRGGRHNGGRRRDDAQAQGGGQAAYPPPGTFSGEMVTLHMGPLALGPRRVHLTLMYEW